MIETSKRYSDKDLAEFKTLIQDKITSAKRDLKRLRDSITQEQEMVLTTRILLLKPLKKDRKPFLKSQILF